MSYEEFVYEILVVFRVENLVCYILFVFALVKVKCHDPVSS